ncbi:MAG: iron-sulfur cluster repair di-iron protein [Alphaproteobacteria bacterium]|nr:MAG: iron-sulfur cluster repair di-iron protein [Alphaproteobacteria bacterium]
MMPQLANCPFGHRNVGEVAATLPGATAVFRSFHIDFCSRGDISVSDAARAKGIEAEKICGALQILSKESTPPIEQSIIDLTDYIQSRYHDTHRTEIRELILLSRKVETVHRDNPKAPAGLADILRQMEGELEVHMKKEELILFPAMRWADGTLDAPISRMRQDHDDHGAFIRELMAKTDKFSPPLEACRSWQALYIGLAKLCTDLAEHIQLENNVLFPRFEVRH